MSKDKVKEAADQAKPLEYPDINPLPELGDFDADDIIEFDLSNLPKCIRTAAEEVARFDQVPHESPAMVGISATCAAIGKKAVIVERRGHDHYAALFFTGIAGSGERKSPVFKKMTKPLDDWARANQGEYEDLKITAAVSNSLIDTQIKALESSVKKEGADIKKIKQGIITLEKERVTPPIEPSLFTTDVTEQMLFKKMYARDGAYAVMSGEGRPIFDALMGKYSGDNTGDAIYLAGISGDKITRDRVGNGLCEEKVIYHPCLNVCVMVQPDKFMEFATNPSLRESGAMARVWPVVLPSTVGDRIESDDDTGINESLLKSYSSMIKCILDHEPVRCEETGDIIPHRVTLSKEAIQARRKLHNSIEIMQREDGDLADVRSTASKAVSQVCKLALAYHIAQDHTVLTDNTSELSIDTWCLAQADGMYFLQEAVKVLRATHEDPRHADARRILKWIMRKKLTSLSATITAQTMPRPRLFAARAGRILDLLSDHGYLVKKEGKGQRSAEYIVNPATLADIATAGNENE